MTNVTGNIKNYAKDAYYAASNSLQNIFHENNNKENIIKEQKKNSKNQNLIKEIKIFLQENPFQNSISLSTYLYRNPNLFNKVKNLDEKKN